MSKVGIICKIEQNRYYILTERGDFLVRPGTPPAGRGLGDRVKLRSQTIWLRRAAIAAALVLVVTASLHLGPWPKQVNNCLALDINPSLEMIYTDDYQLLDWRAFNKEGKEVLEGLKRPEDLYSACQAVFLRCLELDLAQDEQDIFVTVATGVPLDTDLLLEALEGKGTRARLHVVRLEEIDYSSKSGSPLRNYLNRKTGKAISESAPVAEAARDNLGPELAAILEVMPWHNNPIVQTIVDRHLVNGPLNGPLVEEMLNLGLVEDQIAELLELAEGDELTPADIFKMLKDSGLPPGKFLKEYRGQGQGNRDPHSKPQEKSGKDHGGSRGNKDKNEQSPRSNPGQ